MKLKMIAVAAAMLVTGAANAALTVSTGDNSLFFNVWTSDNSYTLKLGEYKIDSFVSGVAAPGAFSQTFGDAALSSFLSGLTSYTWNIVASDTQGQNRVLTTFSTTPTKTLTSDIGRNVSKDINLFAIEANTNGMKTADSITVDNKSTAYAGLKEAGSSALNFVNTGGFGNNNYANGMGLRLVTSGATGIASSIYATQFDDSVGVKAWIGSDSKLHVAAVPEPETYALLLAGLGLMGAVVRRRQRNV